MFDRPDTHSSITLASRKDTIKIQPRILKWQLVKTSHWPVSEATHSKKVKMIEVVAKMMQILVFPTFHFCGISVTSSLTGTSKALSDGIVQKELLE